MIGICAYGYIWYSLDASELLSIINLDGLNVIIEQFECHNRAIVHGVFMSYYRKRSSLRSNYGIMYIGISNMMMTLGMPEKNLNKL